MVLGGIEGSLFHGRGFDSPDVGQAGRVDRDSGHSRIHARIEVVVLEDLRYRVAGGFVEQMHHSEEANAR